jgi:toxin HigB-1
VIRSFKNQETEDVFNGRNTKGARRVSPKTLWKVASRKLDQLDSVKFIEELRIPLGNKFEPLMRDQKGQHSIRINGQYRIDFEWKESGPEKVEIVGYH